MNIKYIKKEVSSNKQAKAMQSGESNFLLHFDLQPSEGVYKIEDNALFIVLSGCATLKFPNRKKLLMSAGEMVFLHKGKNISYENSFSNYKENRYIALFVFTSLEAINLMRTIHPQLLSHNRFQPKQEKYKASTSLFSMCQVIQNLLMDKVLCHGIRLSYVADLLWVIKSYHYPLFEDILQSTNRRSANLRLLVQSMLAFSIQEIIDKSGLSAITFYRIYKELYGIVPGKDKQRMRIETARLLFRSGENSVTRVAHQVGYKQIASLSHTYKRQTGLRPRDEMRSIHSEN